jgi:hypothetical protein
MLVSGELMPRGVIVHRSSGRARAILSATQGLGPRAALPVFERRGDQDYPVFGSDYLHACHLPCPTKRLKGFATSARDRAAIEVVPAGGVSDGHGLELGSVDDLGVVVDRLGMPMSLSASGFSRVAATLGPVPGQSGAERGSRGFRTAECGGNLSVTS